MGHSLFKVLSVGPKVHSHHRSRPLKWMASNKDTNARVTRWFLRLQDYNFTVEHRPGKDIPHADALSRRHEGDSLVALRPGAGQRGRVCGGSLGDRRPGRHHLTSESRTEEGRHHQRREGRVIDHRYFPPQVLNQLDIPHLWRPHLGPNIPALLSSVHSCSLR